MLPPSRWTTTDTVDFALAFRHSKPGTAAAVALLRADPELRHMEAIWAHVRIAVEPRVAAATCGVARQFPCVEIDWLPVRAWADGAMAVPPVRTTDTAGSSPADGEERACSATQRRMLQLAAFLHEGQVGALGARLVQMLADPLVRSAPSWPVRSGLVLDAVTTLLAHPVEYHAKLSVRLEWPWP